MQDQEISFLIVRLMTVTPHCLMPNFFSVIYPVVSLTYPVKRNVRGGGLLVYSSMSWPLSESWRQLVTLHQEERSRE